MSTVVDRPQEDSHPRRDSEGNLQAAAAPTSSAGMALDDRLLPREASSEEKYQYLELNWPAVGSLVAGLASMASFPLAMLANPSLASVLLYAIIPTIGLVTGIRGVVQIRRHPDEFTGIRMAWFGIVLSIVWAIAGWSYMSWVYATEVPENHTRLQYNEISSPDKNVVEIPQRAMELNGQQVFIKGYAYPVDQKTGIRQFLLCRDNGDCCFGGTPKLTDMIFVRLKEPTSIDFSPRIHKMAGRFRVEPGMGLNNFGVVYHLDDAECR